MSPLKEGYVPHPELTPALVQRLELLAADLAVCVADHPDDDRLSRAEAQVRWLLGRRV